jgi:glycosyltransferase involved in cell wall biosynthesis
MVHEMGLENSVEIRFNISDRDKRNLLDQSRLLVLPSSVEGFGIVALEANARGVPVLASDGVPDGAVRDGYNGLKYPFGNIEALTQNLLRVLQNDQIYTCLSKHSIHFAESFKWSSVGGQFESLLELAIGRHA